MVYSKYMKDGGKTEMRKAIAVILTIVLSLCIFAGCGPKKTGENVMAEEDFNIYENGNISMKWEDMPINNFMSFSILGGETNRKLKVGDSVEMLNSLYGNEIICYKDDSGKLQECSVTEYIKNNQDQEYIDINLYRITYDDKIYSTKEIMEMKADENKLFTMVYISFYVDVAAGIINDIGIGQGRRPLGTELP